MTSVTKSSGFQIGDNVVVLDEDDNPQEGVVVRIDPPHFGKVIYGVVLEDAVCPDDGYEYEESELRKVPMTEPDRTDYTDADVVVPLLKAAKTDEEWNAICDKVKKVGTGPGGYPPWWYEKVISAGLCEALNARTR